MDLVSDFYFDCSSHYNLIFGWKKYFDWNSCFHRNFDLNGIGILIIPIKVWVLVESISLGNYLCLYNRFYFLVYLCRVSDISVGVSTEFLDPAYFPHIDYFVYLSYFLTDYLVNMTYVYFGFIYIYIFFRTNLQIYVFYYRIYFSCLIEKKKFFLFRSDF